MKKLSILVAILMTVLMLVPTAIAEEPALSGTLTVVTWAGDPFQSAWNDMFQEFSARTGVVVEMDAIPWENLKEKSALELSGKTGTYDVVYVHPFWFQEFAASGYLLPASQWASEEVMSQYADSLLGIYTVDGEVYGLPDFITTQCLAYRVDLFEEKGLEAPKNWDDILAACEAFQSDDMYGITLPGKKGGALASMFGALMVGEGGWFFDAEGNPTANNEAAVKAAEFLGKLAAYCPNGYMNFHHDENCTLAASGKAAMALIQNPNAKWLDDPERSVTAGKWAYVSIPSSTGVPGGLIDSYCWSVAADSQNPEAAAALAEFIAGTEAQLYFTEKSGTCGATNGYYENNDLLSANPVLAAMQNTFQNAMPIPSWPSWSREQEVLEASLQDVMSGKMTAQECMDKLQSAMMAE